MREFEQLTQGSMSVADYSTRFTRLSRFAPALVMDEESRCRRFELGLSSAIRVHVTAHAFTRYSDLVSRAKTVERDLGIQVRAPTPSSDQGPSGSRDQGQRKRKRPRFDQSAAASPPADAVPGWDPAPIAAVPIQSMQPEKRRCFHCQRIGHIRYHCPDAGRPRVPPQQPQFLQQQLPRQQQQQQPQRQQQPVQPVRRAPAPQPRLVQGRVAALTAEEAQPSGVMVRGIILCSQLSSIRIGVCVVGGYYASVWGIWMSEVLRVVVWVKEAGFGRPGREFPSVGTADAVGGVLNLGVC
ncbi:hypothetical protein QJS04_geneDACA021270 [Acorus gramineus]|uniref:CCHC-type domain-containing protein n=1 Tax=Acorus gramineus TaxID=55184 RepID=A0AAV9BVV2_ACOGR|nr:hypothetical protein QJS04_geneDACA021270 [Acorus gramineus]